MPNNASKLRVFEQIFSLQLRREGAGTFLLDSEVLGDLSSLNSQDLHARLLEFFPDAVDLVLNITAGSVNVGVRIVMPDSSTATQASDASR